MIEINELEELLNTLQTSSLEPHDEYKMEFTNREQRLIHEYIKQLQQKNQQLKEQLKQRNEIIDELKNYIANNHLTRSIDSTQIYDGINANRELQKILKKYKGDNNG